MRQRTAVRKAWRRGVLVAWGCGQGGTDGPSGRGPGGGRRDQGSIAPGLCQFPQPDEEMLGEPSLPQWRAVRA